MLLKNVWMPTLIVLLASVILMYTYIGGDESFLIWVIIYTVFTFIAAWITKVAQVKKNSLHCSFLVHISAHHSSISIFSSGHPKADT
ncbi:DUF2651 family protein [Bacillus sp. DWP3-1]|uniref:DUF2651 family protein n=1 Tax=unclassified Bacillus (in: firmicutes) TaxID=185979 RepID=UPI003CE9776A